jgi:hypothetical protein
MRLLRNGSPGYLRACCSARLRRRSHGANSVQMTRKALVILDQVPASELARLVVGGDGVAWSVGAARLEFIPRTTPVGHATISSGRLPRSHRVQGRRWYSAGRTRHDVDTLQRYPLPAASSHIDPAIAHDMDRTCVAQALRDDDGPRWRRPIVAASGKGFVTFMLGGRAADVLIFPYSTVPTDDGLGDYRLVLGILAQSNEGQDAIRSAARAVGRAFQAFGQRVPWLVLQDLGVKAGGYVGLELHWVVPRSWHSSSNPGQGARAVKRAWIQAMDPYWSHVDDLIQEIALNVLVELERLYAADGVALLSRFSTDTFGHLYGVGSPAYVVALQQSVQAVEQLARLQFNVAMTSDHGGRPTAQAIRFDERLRTTIPPMPLPMPPAVVELFRSGDHLVGYSDMLSRVAGPTIECWDGQALRSIQLPASLLAASFHPGQTPACLLVPEQTYRFSEGGPAQGGGDHGCGIAGSSPAPTVVDGEVPIAYITMQAPPVHPPLPLVLQDVRDWFVRI